MIVSRAKELGASLAGIASLERVLASPSHGALPGQGKRFQEFESVLVIALSHPLDRPDLDWWDGQGGSPGDRALIKIMRDLSAWIDETFKGHAMEMPYSAERGGIYLKDAAVEAGLGCIGKNNLLVTPDFGPRVRLRAMLLQEGLPPAPPPDFDPCRGCEEFCMKACPQQAFERQQSQSAGTPGAESSIRETGYQRQRCMSRMEADVEESRRDVTGPGGERVIRYCRACELACPAGKNG